MPWLTNALSAPRHAFNTRTRTPTHRGVAKGLNISSTFVRSKPTSGSRSAKRARTEAAGSGATDAGAAGGAAAPGAAAAMEVDAAGAPSSGTAPAEPPVAAGEQAGAEGPAAEQDKGEAEQEEEEAPVVTYAQYYAERWGQGSLAEGQPLLLAARVSRQQLARGLDLRRARKRSFALHLEPEGAYGRLRASLGGQCLGT